MTTKWWVNLSRLTRSQRQAQHVRNAVRHTAVCTDLSMCSRGSHDLKTALPFQALYPYLCVPNKMGKWPPASVSWLCTFSIRRTIACLEAPPRNISLYLIGQNCVSWLLRAAEDSLEILARFILPSKIRCPLASKKGKMDIGPAPTECTQTGLELVLCRKRFVFCSSLYSRLSVVTWQILTACFL